MERRTFVSTELAGHPACPRFGSTTPSPSARSLSSSPGAARLRMRRLRSCTTRPAGCGTCRTSRIGASRSPKGSTDLAGTGEKPMTEVSRIRFFACGNGDTILLKAEPDHWGLIDCHLTQTSGARERIRHVIDEYNVR